MNYPDLNFSILFKILKSIPEGGIQSRLVLFKTYSDPPQPYCSPIIKSLLSDLKWFSLSGMDKADQMEARVAQAIKLGAKPGKKPCLPYSELQAKIKVEKDAIKHQKVAFLL